MQKIKSYLLIFILSGLITSCAKKKYPDSVVDNTPEFYFKGTIGGVPVDLETGLNNYYMYSSYNQDLNNVYNFIGNIKQSTGTPNNIQFQINDNRTSPVNGYTIIDSALFAGNYPYFAGTPGTLSYNAQFKSKSNTGAQSYNWNFGDGYTSTLANPNHIYKNLGKYNVCLNILDSVACSNSLCSVQKISLVGSNCKTSISVSNVFLDSVSFSQTTTGALPFTYLWNFGDGTPLNTSNNPVHNYLSPGNYNVSLRAIDNNNDTAFAYYHASTQFSATCATNYSISSLVPVSNPLAFSNIIITWVDAGGTVYTSNNVLQPSSSYFQIVSVTAHSNNENNQTVKKLHVKFKCTVYNGGSPLIIDNGDAVIAVAYK